MRSIHTAIIGFGLSGRVFHAPFINLSEKFHLSKILSGREQEINRIYPTVEVVKDPDSIFKDPHIELVIIASPNTEHYKLAKLALESGKHTVVEKPFVIDTENGKALIELAYEKGKMLSVFQNRRWDGDFKTVKKIVDSGVLGTISEYEAHFDRFCPEPDFSGWRTQDLPGSGVLFDLGPHLIDQAIALFGLPKAVFGDIRISRETGLVDDCFDLILFYNHLRVRLKAGVLVRELGPHFIIHGSKGSFVKYGLDPQENMLKSGAIPSGDNWGEEEEMFYGILNVIKDGKDVREKLKTLNGNYMGFFDNVYDAIILGKPLEVSADIALQNIQLIQLAMQSSKLQKILTL